MIIILLLVFCGLGITNVNASENSKIVVGLDINVSPMGFLDSSGNIPGFDVDLAKVSVKQNLEIVLDYPEKIDNLLKYFNIYERKLKSQSKKPPYRHKNAYTEEIWRSGWDSNPRAVTRKLISSQPRYDHFDTAACMSPFFAGSSIL